MDAALYDQAIKSALNQAWKQAIKINLEILDINKNDVCTLNRLAFAYLKTGNLNAARNIYKRVLKIDKYNPIAQKNLKRIAKINKQDIHQSQISASTPSFFLEEPGKTKIVTLVHPAPTKVLCNIMTAQKINLLPRKHSIEVRNHQNEYIGALPDDISHRLRHLIGHGNTYEAYIKNVDNNQVSVFIREMTRGKKYKNLPSFSPSYSLSGQVYYKNIHLDSEEVAGDDFKKSVLQTQEDNLSD